MTSWSLERGEWSVQAESSPSDAGPKTLDYVRLVELELGRQVGVVDRRAAAVPSHHACVVRRHVGHLDAAQGVVLHGKGEEGVAGQVVHVDGAVLDELEIQLQRVVGVTFEDVRRVHFAKNAVDHRVLSNMVKVSEVNLKASSRSSRGLLDGWSRWAG